MQRNKGAAIGVVLVSFFAWLIIDTWSSIASQLASSSSTSEAQAAPAQSSSSAAAPTEEDDPVERIKASYDGPPSYKSRKIPRKRLQRRPADPDRRIGEKVTAQLSLQNDTCGQAAPAITADYTITEQAEEVTVVSSTGFPFTGRANPSGFIARSVFMQPSGGRLLQTMKATKAEDGRLTISLRVVMEDGKGGSCEMVYGGAAAPQ